jgi:uncharacterized hydrophobic protein (TIGR00341 family)
MTSKEKQKEPQPEILAIKKSEQYKTVEELFKKSHPDSVYYTLLALSSVIVASGILLANPTIVIGGMLVTPLLTPILIIALGISVGDIKAIRSSSILVLKSILIIIGLSFLLAFLFGAKTKDIYSFGDSLHVAVLYFVVAFVSGAAATFAWVRKEVTEILPGVAIAVSLIPPLGVLGVSLIAFSFSVSRLALLVFTFNLIGVILGSIVVFSLLKFYKSEKIVHQEAASQDLGKK